MSGGRNEDLHEVLVVSCDIVGHSSELVHGVQLGRVVERQYNEVVCRGGYEGDTMFVILRGRVGVYKTHGEDDTRPIEPHFSHQEGDVVGELALALGRNRTADLVALTPVVLLSFHYQDIMKHLESVTGNQAAGCAREAIEGSISRRVLREISGRRAYFPLEPQIFPVVFGPARPERVAPGVTPIRVGPSGAEAVDQLAQRLEALRSGLLPPPHGETEIIDLPLG